jgi:hypothetical protein
MKILYAGCSFVLGAEVDRSKRFSKLVSGELGASEHNIASGGRSNMLSLALTIAKAQEISPDYIVFGVSGPTRHFGMVDLSQHSNYDDLTVWEGDEYANNKAVVFSFGPTLPAPNQAINRSLPVYRNNLFVGLELACITSTLAEYSQQSGTPVCVFPAMKIQQYTKSINGVDITDTVLDVKESAVWLDTNFENLAEQNADVMQYGHPGALTHRQFASILSERIKKDLNERNHSF